MVADADRVVLILLLQLHIRITLTIHIILAIINAAAVQMMNADVVRLMIAGSGSDGWCDNGAVAVSNRQSRSRLGLLRSHSLQQNI
jgi:hypothetical protein